MLIILLVIYEQIVSLINECFFRGRHTNIPKNQLESDDEAGDSQTKSDETEDFKAKDGEVQAVQQQSSNVENSNSSFEESQRTKDILEKGEFYMSDSEIHESNGKSGTYKSMCDV